MTTATINRTTTTPEGSVAASALLRAIVAVKPLAKPTYWTDKPSLPARIRLDWADALTLTTTDGETWASYEIRTAVCTKPGSVIIQASLLAAVAKTTGQVTVMASGDDQVRFASGAGNSLLPRTVDPDWPEAPATAADTDGSWPAWPVDPAHLRAVLPAASTDYGRPILCAVAFQPGAMVATDSYRLHYIDTGLPDYPNLLIPEHALRWVAKETEPVSLSATADGTCVRISGGAQTWIVQTVVSGTEWDAAKKARVPLQYPAWRQLVPKSQPTHLAIDRAEILRAVRHCMSINPPSSWTPIPVVMEIKATSVRFTRNIPDTCSFETSAVGRLDGQEMTVAFNGHILRDCIAAGSGDTVTLGITEPRSPVLVTDDGKCVRLLMPVRIT